MLGMSAASIGFYILQTADIAAHLPAKLTFKRVFFYGLADRIFFFRREVFRLFPNLNSKRSQSRNSAGPADSKDRSQTDLEAFIFRYCDSGNSQHGFEISNLKF